MLSSESNLHVSRGVQASCFHPSGRKQKLPPTISSVAAKTKKSAVTTRLFCLVFVAAVGLRFLSNYLHLQSLTSPSPSFSHSVSPLFSLPFPPLLSPSLFVNSSFQLRQNKFVFPELGGRYTTLKLIGHGLPLYCSLITLFPYS